MLFSIRLPWTASHSSAPCTLHAAFEVVALGGTVMWREASLRTQFDAQQR
jgi:hypothetical protein